MCGVETPSGSRQETQVRCTRCGTCCVAPDISTLGKPAGQPCRYLGNDLRCTIYDSRPEVCRRYRPDEICRLIAAPTLRERVQKYARLLGIRLEDCD